MKARLLLCLLIVASVVGAQNTTLNALEDQRTALEKQIKESEKLLNTATKSYTSQLNNLTIINGQIVERQKAIRLMNDEMQALQRQINALNREIRQLEANLKDRRTKYEASVQYLRRNRSVEDKLLFIFSADNFNQIYRRLRYVREYASFQRMQGEEIKAKQQELAKRREEVAATRARREALLKEEEASRSALQTKERQQRQIVNQLQRRQKGLQDELTKKRRQANQLNARIDAYINAAIERTATDEQRTAAAKPNAAPMKGFTMNKADRELSGSFTSNRGKLPVPVTGPFSIVSRYGQYNVSGLRNVKLDNKGIDIQAQAGAQARAVFDGEVSAVFRFQGNGLYNVLVRHGNYISVYCNLSSTSVKQGDRVKTGATLGRIFSDSADGNRTVLHFQLRKERDQMNPEPWLDK
jgi:septal ring factor EnvC (AmiA/AmiB activator)